MCGLQNIVRIIQLCQPCQQEKERECGSQTIHNGSHSLIFCVCTHRRTSNEKFLLNSQHVFVINLIVMLMNLEYSNWATVSYLHKTRPNHLYIRAFPTAFRHYRQAFVKMSLQQEPLAMSNVSPSKPGQTQ